MNNATDGSKVKQPQKELKLHLFMLSFMFLGKMDYGGMVSMQMKRYYTATMTALLHSGTVALCPLKQMSSIYIKKLLS